jgi:hypothetical protein
MMSSLFPPGSPTNWLSISLTLHDQYLLFLLIFPCLTLWSSFRFHSEFDSCFLPSSSNFENLIYPCFLSQFLIWMLSIIMFSSSLQSCAHWACFGFLTTNQEINCSSPWLCPITIFRRHGFPYILLQCSP